MQVHLTDDQKAFIRDGIQSGRFSREEDALQEALSLWERRERRRAEILAAVDVAEASFARGEGRRIATREEAAQFAEVGGVRLLPQAEAELDDIWLYIASESGSSVPVAGAGSTDRPPPRS
jgi:Arc/MetJ-type ribon-helix-helix transcriptional regulator